MSFLLLRFLLGYAMSRRLDKVNALLRNGISQIISEQMGDPRLPTVISITHINTTSDLKQAKVFVSVLADEEEKQLTIDALTSGSGFLHKELRKIIELRHVPELTFVLDESIEKSETLFKLIRQGIYPNPY